MVRITRMFTHMRLSVRLTIAYGAVMAIVIVFIVFLTAGAVYYMMYHQAEVEMGATMRHVVQLIDRDGNTTVIGKIPPAAEEHGSDPKLPHVRILNKVPIDSIMPSDTDALPMPMQAGLALKRSFVSFVPSMMMSRSTGSCDMSVEYITSSPDMHSCSGSRKTVVRPESPSSSTR